MGQELNDIILQMCKVGVKRYGKVRFYKLLRRKFNIITANIDGFREGSNITINIIKKFQKIPTQYMLDSFHTMFQSIEIEKENQENLRDINLYRQLSDFIDLFKPQEFVIIKFNTHPKEFCVRYVKTQTLNMPWLLLWMKHYPTSVIEYCTDVHSYLRVFGPLCSVVNLSNLLNRIESNEVNYTFILMSLAVFPLSDISPISRNATKEMNEIFKPVIYEDSQRKINKIRSEIDRLVYSRTRNIFNLPALQGTNSLCYTSSSASS